MNVPLVFLDTETTGLSLEDDIWEIAAIRREPDGTERELHLFVEHDTDKCVQLPQSFRDDHRRRWVANEDAAVTPGEAAREIRMFTEGCHVVGAVPNFDTERLAAMLREEFLRPAWHYHLIDVENLAIGWLTAKGGELELPWKSDALAELCGIPPIPTSERHTAMGDARWVRDWFDAIIGTHR